MADKTQSVFRNRNFRLFFIGQFISVFGTWLQTGAQGWLVWKITHSAVALGEATFSFFIASAIVAPFVGVMIDRFGWRIIVNIAQVLGMLQALSLAALFFFGHPQFWQVNVLFVFAGIANAFDHSSKHSELVELVESHQLKDAIPWMTTMINGGQICGMGLAGLLLVWIGAGWLFVTNAASFTGVLITTAMIRDVGRVQQKHEHPLKMILQGTRYTFLDRNISPLVAVLSATIIFGYSFRPVLPAITSVLMHAGPKVYGYLAAISGAGAVIGGMIYLKIGKLFATKTLTVSGCLLLAIGLFAFSLTSTFRMAAASMLFIGICWMLIGNSTRSGIALYAKGEKLGRVQGWMTTVIFGSVAVGGEFSGFVAHHVGLRAVSQISSVVLLAVTAAIAILLKPAAPQQPATVDIPAS